MIRQAWRDTAEIKGTRLRIVAFVVTVILEVIG